MVDLMNPKYKLHSHVINQGINLIRNRGCDVGIHGTIPSATDNGFLELEKEDLFSIIVYGNSRTGFKLKDFKKRVSKNSLAAF